LLLAIPFLLAPAARADADTPILLALDLPIVARDLRHDGIPHSEVRAVILGSRERHLHCDEIHATLVRSHEAILVHGPVDHYDDLILVPLDRGVRGPDLYLYIDDAFRTHGHKEEAVIVAAPAAPAVFFLDHEHDHGHDYYVHDYGHDHGHDYYVHDYGHGPGKGHYKGHGKGHGK
jgi:hypothetical protein